MSNKNQKVSAETYVPKFKVDTFAKFKTVWDEKKKRFCLPWNKEKSQWDFSDGFDAVFANSELLNNCSEPVMFVVLDYINNAISNLEKDYFDDFVLDWLQKAYDLAALNAGERARLKFLEENGASGKNYKKSEEVYEKTVLEFLNQFN